MLRHLLLSSICVWSLGAALPAAARAESTSAAPPTVSTAPPTVGMPRTIRELVLPGSELEAAPLTDRRAPIVLRIVRSAPHGTAWRYDLTWYGLEPGRYDLRSRLRRKDGSATADLPELPVEVVSALPPAFTPPHELAARPVEGFGRYRFLLGGLFGLWVVGFGLILVVGRRRAAAIGRATAGRPTTAEQLRPLVERGIAGSLTPTECAELERMLLDYWVARLDLRREKPARLFSQLRDHDEAGPLVRRLEAWLHQPPQAGGVAVSTGELEALLSPYLDSADAQLVRGAAS